ncbi:hypothetical protein PPTG_10656 [Phytophthora nicotianae INRA-310]|uniref:Elicitor-like transglutaminase n=1 Tax=Phytophthora nicotianae (strain INRA-310) TaxID=761204 RepID=W2QBK0_PHYN3|nr:hypothetical protein PPTG_10656 [Phytophthora nicotianae INRA-310]ETN10532.1 hypothetical protein PPTG_10656 [Phytophthora nicotianae INRA-310]
MVKTVHAVALGVVIAAAAVELTQATSLNCNAYMPTGADVPLTNDHPAVMKDYNGAVPVEYPVDQCKASEFGPAGRKLRRMEDAPSSDITDLETYFGESLEMDFTTLKEQYSSASAPTTPWPGSYWPAYQDSINVIWKSGEKSASAKYAEAFGLDPVDLMNKISAGNGIDAYANNTKCTTDADCTSRNDGSVCSIRKDASSGYCIATWYGICHAWAPAAILENEPKCDVVKNGQTFHAMDIKALLTEVYDGSAIPTVFTGARFNGPDTPVSTDQYGRYTSAARRDLGAGFFHLAITNIMGKHKQSFILDVTAGAQVWNQPVRSYKVQTMELMDNAQASQQYFNTGTYPFNAEMVYLAYVKTTVSWIIEAYADGPLASSDKVDTYTVSNDYEYLLELDANYAVIGGEWVGRSKTDHPDFLWFPTAKPDENTVTSTGLSYANVKELLDMSVACGAPEGASTSTSKGASTSTSESASTSTSASASASETASGSASGSVSWDGSTTLDSTSNSSSTGGSGVSGEGSYAVSSASEDGSATVASSSGSSESTTVTTDTYSKSSSGSTIEVTAASLPNGLDTLTITPETSSPTVEESATVTDAPIDTGYYTAPPTTAGQDLADVLDTINTTGSSSLSETETVIDVESTSQQESATTVHNSCH